MRKKKYFVLFLLIACLMVSFVGCKPKEKANNEYTINFETNGGSAVESFKIDDSNEVYLAQVSEKEGYLFSGWFLDNETFIQKLDLKYLNENPKKKEITLYAKWQAVESCFDFAFLDDTQTAYSVTRKKGATMPTTLVIPKTFAGKPVTEIRKNAFANCGELLFVTISDTIKSVGDNAFNMCNKMWKLTFEEGSQLVSVGKSAFKGCETLEYVSMPACESLGLDAFAECDSIESFMLPEGLKTIGGGAFNSCFLLEKITIPKSVTSIGANAFGYCFGLLEINVAEGNTRYESINGNLYDDWVSILLQYAVGNKSTVFVAPAGLRIINDCAFAGAKTLKKVVLPTELTRIGEKAFKDCEALEHMVIPPNVTSIGKEAFKNCGALAHITIPPNVTSIGKEAFGGCKMLTIHADITEANKPADWELLWNGECPVDWLK